MNTYLDISGSFLFTWLLTSEFKQFAGKAEVFVIYLKQWLKTTESFKP